MRVQPVSCEVPEPVPSIEAVVWLAPKHRSRPGPLRILSYEVDNRADVVILAVGAVSQLAIGRDMTGQKGARRQGGCESRG